MKARIWATAISAIVFSSVAAAQAWQFDKSHTRVGFTVDHLGFSTVVGDFRQFDGAVQYDPKKPDDLKVSFEIATTSIDSGWAARDEHLRKADFFNVEKFPKMTFESTAVKVLSENRSQVTGNLTLLGVTKPVTLDVTLNKMAINPITNLQTAGITATTTIKRSDWGMTTYVPAVGEDIPVRIDAELTPVTNP
ncbi:MAG: YceI family protein [Pseudomonadota bacterium]|nr:YceI family protein [Pseudomonadota bacterium]